MQVRTILSQNTTDATSHRAFASLKAAFPGEKGWAEVLRAPSGLFLLENSALATYPCHWIMPINDALVIILFIPQSRW